MVTDDITDDDRYSEIFLDIESGVDFNKKNKHASSEKKKGRQITAVPKEEEEQKEDGSVFGGEGAGSMSIGDLYKHDRTTDHFTTKLASE